VDPRVFHPDVRASGDDVVAVPHSVFFARGEVRFAVGDPLVDSYLEFVAGRSRST
jgi:hypothetical protein